MEWQASAIHEMVLECTVIKLINRTVKITRQQESTEGLKQAT